MDTSDTLVLPLHSQASMLATVGGKGANLSELVRAGFPVPDGFLITTAAYRSFVEDNDLQQQIVDLTARGVGTDFEAVSAAICQLFEHGSMPPEVPRANELRVGDELYGIPWHICPTVALHDRVFVVRDGRVTDQGTVVARA